VKPVTAEIHDQVFTSNSAPKLFCKIRLGSEIHSTPLAIRNQKYFIWSEDYKFRRNNERVIEIEVYHKNFFISPDLIGEGKCCFTRNLRDNKFILVCNISQNEVEIGTINLEFIWEPDISMNSSWSPIDIPLEQPIRPDYENLYDEQFKDQQIQTEVVLVENDQDQENEKCVTCFETKKLVAFYKCGHICCCEKCALRFIQKRCPFCRERVNDFIKVYRVS